MARLLRRERGAVWRLPIPLNPNRVALLALILGICSTHSLAGSATTNHQPNRNKNANKQTPTRTIGPLTPSNHDCEPTGHNTAGTDAPTTGQGPHSAISTHIGQRQGDSRADSTGTAGDSSSGSNTRPEGLPVFKKRMLASTPPWDAIYLLG